MSTKEIDKGFKRIRQEIEKADSLITDVGIFDQGQHPGTDITVAAVGYINEYGNKENNVPKRSFIKYTVRKNREKYLDLIVQISEQIKKGRWTAEYGFNELGRVIEEDIKERIENIRTPKNKAGTIKHKGENNPLIDSGVVHDAIDHRVKRKYSK